jgi:eukaryotic-like serine/threonine-protein kinase
MSEDRSSAFYALIRAGSVLADKYRVERSIGVGGFGVVLAATHIHLEERVALKLLLPEAAANQEAATRFLREAKAAVKIKSEHVARVIDVGMLPNGVPYMVMEYLEGCDLSKLVKERGAQRIQDVVEWVLQACEALAEAHVAGIIHRDLKPANLFLTLRPDGSPAIKVLDFGISKVMPALGEDKGMTKTTDVMGSPYYMSPEQMKSTRSVDARTDIWALGTILFEMVGGAPPFDGETMPALLAAILQEPPRNLHELRADVPQPLVAVILKCLEKDPAARFANVAELAAALGPFAPARSHASIERVAAVTHGKPHSAARFLGGSAGPFSPDAASTSDPSVSTEPGVPPPGMGAPVDKTAPSASGPSGASASWGATVGASRGRSRTPVFAAVALLSVAALGAVGVFIIGPLIRTPSEPPVPEPAVSTAARASEETETEPTETPEPSDDLAPEVSAEGEAEEPVVSASALVKPTAAPGLPPPPPKKGAIVLPPTPGLIGGLPGPQAPPPSAPKAPASPPPPSGDLFGTQD